MVEMSAQRWQNTLAYLRELFGSEDRVLEEVRARSQAASLPDIAVSAEVGRFLQLLTSLSNSGHGAELAVEVGTLGGYSGIWLARGLAPGGRLITVEPEPSYADFATESFRAAGVLEQVEVRRQKGIPALAVLADELGPGSVDVLFIDAIKTEYLDYLKAARPLLKPGGLLVADNVLGTDSYWIDDAPGASPDRDAVDAFNRALAADSTFESVLIPLRQGLLVARKDPRTK